MTLRFAARGVVTDVQPDGFLVAVLTESAEGDGVWLQFQSKLDGPDERDVVLGRDTYCVFADEGPAFGCVREAVLSDRVLRIVLSADSLALLGVAESEIEVSLEVDQDAVTHFREGLAMILAYGREDARPRVMNL